MVLSKLWMAKPSCLKLLVHCVRAAASRTFCTAGKSKPIKMAIIAITTKSSISVNADLIIFITSFPKQCMGNYKLYFILRPSTNLIWSKQFNLRVSFFLKMEYSYYNDIAEISLNLVKPCPYRPHFDVFPANRT